MYARDDYNRSSFGDSGRDYSHRQLQGIMISQTDKMPSRYSVPLNSNILLIKFDPVFSPLFKLEFNPFLTRYCLSPNVYNIALGGTMPYKDTSERRGYDYE